MCLGSRLFSMGTTGGTCAGATALRFALTEYLNMMGCAHCLQSTTLQPPREIPVCSGREGPDTPEGAAFKAGG